MKRLLTRRPTPVIALLMCLLELLLLLGSGLMQLAHLSLQCLQFLWHDMREVWREETSR